MRITKILNIAIVVFIVFAILISVVAVFHIPTPKTTGPPPVGPVKPPESVAEVVLSTINKSSIPLSAGSWICVIGLLVWRGRTRSLWSRLGFDQDVFQLFVKMRGASTRLKLLRSLSSAKDRAQLAEELGIDWKAVDRHVQVLRKYGFIEEKDREGTARFYELTPSGEILLKLIKENELQGGSEN